MHSIKGSQKVTELLNYITYASIKLTTSLVILDVKCYVVYDDATAIKLSLMLTLSDGGVIIKQPEIS